MDGQMVYQSFSMTVSEGKRLVAKGVAALPCVQQAMTEGVIVVTRSTTSGYVLEELLGHEVDRASFVTGKTLPAGYPERSELLTGDLGSAVLRKGQWIEGMELDKAMESMSDGDVIVK